MQILSAIQNIKNHLNSINKEGEASGNGTFKRGFVPTMGALHRGHISLLERAKRENNIAIASIFVNPLQFNDKKDLEKYPRTLESDIEKLKSANCDVLFIPTVEEMYPDESTLSGDIKNPPFKVDLNGLDKFMEGKHRPGHFHGVCVVVKKLFDIIEPDRAYFGEKDFQQLAIIKHMVKELELPIEIINCPTVREADGLAMSSRNTLLTSDERKNAADIYKTLQEARALWAAEGGEGAIQKIKIRVEEKINENPFLQLEYFEIVNSENLLPVQSPEETKNLRACIAVKAGRIRLIDNIPL